MAIDKSGWRDYDIQNISLSPSKYVASLQWQVAPKKLTASRLAAALSEDSHQRVSTATASKVLRRHSGLKRKGFGQYSRR